MHTYTPLIFAYILLTCLYLYTHIHSALDKFLSTLSKHNQGWSISLFHYRNHGHDFGRVLASMLVKNSQLYAFHEFLQKLGYTYIDETNNEAYIQFLK